jgi:hypothetical protein
MLCMLGVLSGFTLGNRKKQAKQENILPGRAIASCLPSIASGTVIWVDYQQQCVTCYYMLLHAITCYDSVRDTCCIAFY